MLRKRLALIACTVMVAVAATGLTTASDRWLHIKVVEEGRGGDNVNINLPISMIESLLPLIQTNELRGGRVRIGSDFGADIFEGIDIRKVLQALQDAPDADFITVKSDDENVRVSKEKGILKIDVDGRYDHERVRVRIPLTVIDAMIADDPYELDILAGIRALSAYGGGDLVTVESDDSTVRIWIDDNQTAD